MKIRLTGVCDVGKARRNNQDAIALCTDLAGGQWLRGRRDVADATAATGEPSGEMPDGGDRAHVVLDSGGYHSGEAQTVAVVADGLGGKRAGEVASQLAIDTIERALAAAPAGAGNEHFEQALARVVALADDHIFDHAQQHPATGGMATTVVACWLAGGVAHVAWCGDSRCYHFGPRTGLRRLTHDHSYVQQLIDSGELTPRKAFRHPDNHIITRGCGDIDCKAEPEFAHLPLDEGDVLLLCSDGLSGCCRDCELEQLVLRHYSDPEACRDALLDAALAAGAPDNVSVVLVSAIGDDDDAPRPTAALRWRRLTAPLRKWLSRS